MHVGGAARQIDAHIAGNANHDRAHNTCRNAAASRGGATQPRQSAVTSALSDSRWPVALKAKSVVKSQ